MSKYAPNVEGNKARLVLSRISSQKFRKFLMISCSSLLLLSLSYVLIVFVQVWWNSTRDQAHPVDAIVVLGAAQWDGVPSPVLEARLEEALRLYNEGLSPVIVTTGSKQRGDRFTEAYTGLTYLLERSIPESAILVVVDGTNTFESLSATANVLVEKSLTRITLYERKRSLEKLV